MSPTTPAGPTGPVTRLADLLAEAGTGTRPGPREMAELLWLAGQLTPGGMPAPDPNPLREPRTDSAREPTPPSTPEPSPTAPHTPPPPGSRGAPEASRTPDPDRRVPLHLPAPPDPRRPGTGGHRTLHVPAPPMLARPLTLQRALRPLKRRVAAPSGHVLDEAATAHRIAALNAAPAWWLPVLRPASERWLRLDLVYDTGPTMPVWRPLVRELRAAIAQSGIFRTVTVHRAGPDGRVHHDGAPAPVDGRTVTLLVSDCMGPQWRPGAAGDRWYALLRRWAARMPLAVVQPLPEHLWRTTALPTTPGLLTAPAPAAPNAALAFEGYDGETRPPEERLPLPVLEPTATWLTHWAELVADSGGRQLPGAVAWLGPRPTPSSASEGSAPDRLTPEDLVLRFRSLASPEAFRLAGHLAVGRPELAVMRLVQAAVEPRPQPQHLAEVILSGLLTTPRSAAPGAYAFRPGVRELLLGTLPRTAQGRTEQLLARVGGLIEDLDRRVTGSGFPAVAPVGGDGPAPDGAAFATLPEESVARMGAPIGSSALIGGRYRIERALGPHDKYWSARDERTGDMVVLRLHDTDLGGWPGEIPVHPNVVRVLEVGLHEERPFMALEYVVGPTLASYRTNAQETERFATQLLDGLTALHEAGVVHGRLVAENILIAPDGTPKISGLALHDRPGKSREGDLRALGRILGQLNHHRWDHRTALPERFSSLVQALESGQLLAAELREAALPAVGASIDFVYVSHTADPGDARALEQAVTGVLGRAELRPEQYQIVSRHSGLTVTLRPGASVTRILTAVVEGLTIELPPAGERPRVLVAFSLDSHSPVPQSAPEIQEALDEFDTEAVVVVAFALRDLLAEELPDVFSRLSLLPLGDAAGYTQDGWYTRLTTPADAPPLPVRGPFALAGRRPTGDERRAIVFVRPDGTLVRADSTEDQGRPERYYEVDLAEHRYRLTLELPSADAGQEFTVDVAAAWQVVDPLAAARSGVSEVPRILEDRLSAEASQITRRLSRRQTNKAQLSLNAHLRTQTASGYRARWTTAVRVRPAIVPADPIATVLSRAETVLLGFDGPVAHLYADRSPHSAARELAGLIAELRDPEDALAGRGMTPRLMEGTVHPLDILRTYAHHPMGEVLRGRLDEIELRAIRTARPTRHAERLIRVLKASGRRVVVVSDTSHAAMSAWFAGRSSFAVPDGVVGRSDRLDQLMPDPACMLRALAPRSPAPTCVVIGTSLPEFEAARHLELDFIGYAYPQATRARLLTAGCELIVDSLDQLADVIRAE